MLDASVAFSWRFPGDPAENTPYSRLVLARLADLDAIVPEVWALEIANGIFVSFNRRKRITAPQIREYLGLLKDLSIRVERQEMWANLDLESSARRWNLAAYDAAYLVLALRHNCPLATTDGDLSKVARAEGVPILE